MNIRLQKTKQLLSKHALDAALISSIPNIIYLTDFAHFSTEEREAYLLITHKNQYLFTDARYTHAVKKHLPHFILKEIGYEHSFSRLLNEIIQEENLQTLGIETNNLTVYEYQKICKSLFSHNSLTTNPYNLAPNIKHFDLSSLRLIKDPSELTKIQKACELGDQTFQHILQKIRPGITEKEIAFEMELFIKKTGHTLSFPTIVAFEENAAIPHHKTSNRQLNPNEFILLDFGVNYDNYCSDMTRTIHFGKPTQEKTKTYQTVLESQQKSIDYITTSLRDHAAIAKWTRQSPHKQDKAPKASQTDQLARDYITSQNFPTIPHSLGHGTGLQVHEPPTLSPKSQDTIEEGMVFSIEPGIYLPNQFGIRIEDLFTIKNNELIQLTKSPKKELIEI